MSGIVPLFFHEKPAVVPNTFGGFVSSFRVGTLPSSVQLNLQTDGSVTASFVDIATQNEATGDRWFTPITVGIGNTHWVRATTTGDPLSSGTTGSWQQLNATRAWSLSSDGGFASLRVTFLFLEISSSVTGTPVIASGMYRLEANNEV